MEGIKTEGVKDTHPLKIYLGFAIITTVVVGLVTLSGGGIAQYLMACNLVFYLWLCWKRLSSRIDSLLEIDTVYLLFWGFYIVFPTSMYTFGNTGIVNLNYGDTYKEQGVDVIVALCISAGLIGFALGLYFPLGAKLASLLPRMDGPWNKWEAYISSGGYIGFGLLLLSYFVLNVGVAVYLEGDYGSSYKDEAGWGYLVAGIFFLQIGIIVVFLTGIESRMRWVSIILLLIFTLIAFRTGRRRIVVEMMIAIVVLQNFYVQRIKISRLVIGTSIILATLVAIGQARAYSSGGIDAMYAYLTTDFGTQEFVHLFDDGEGMYFVLSETVKYIQTNGDYRYGQTFYEAFQILIPKVINPIRPIAPSEWFAQYYDSEYAAKGGGYSYTLMAEGYLNFGLFGVVLIGLFQGLAINILYQYRLQDPKSISRGIIYAISIASVFGFMRSDFASMLKIYILSTGMPSLLIALWLGRRSVPNQYHDIKLR